VIGQIVSHYEILEKLGGGGMGVVYKGRDIKLDRIVAIKFLAAHLIDSKTAQIRFLQEARAISALNHPNIAIVYEAGDHQGQSFLVLEYLPGGTLLTKLGDLRTGGRKMPIAKAASLSLQLAEGLAHAHQTGILHRDIKPGNLMFSADGTLKITDFGLAKFLSGPDITNAGTPIGTVPYMSPEQARGLETDHQSDLFSAGIVMYEVISGELPFRAPDERGTIKQILRADPPPLETLRPDSPRSLRSIVHHLLQKNPRKRYQKADDLVLDLRAVQRELEAPTHTMLSRDLIADQKLRLIRRPILWALAVCALLAVLGFVVVPRLRHLPGQGMPSRKHIAVLQFENIGGDADNGAFCEGLVETLTSSLTELEHFQGSLMVVPASEVRKQNIHSTADARRAFNVNLVITGSVQRSEGVMRLHANLVDTKSETQIAARSIASPIDQLNGLQDQVVREVADLLELQLQPKTLVLLAAGQTSNASAYDLYVQARGYLDRWDKPGNLDRAMELLKTALNRDPRYALGYAALSQANWLKYGTTRETKWLEEAQELGLHAIDLDKQVPAAHVNLGKVYVYTSKYPEAIQEFKAALELNPVSVEAYRELADAYKLSNRPKEAENVYQTAIQLRPSDWLSYTMLGIFYYEHSRYPEAETAFNRVVELTPDNYSAWYNLGALHLTAGKYDQAAEEFHKSIGLRPGPGGYLGLANVYYAQGRYSESAETNEKALALGPNSYVAAGNLADSYRWAPGLKDKAPAMYRRAIENVDRALITNSKDAYALSCRALYWANLGNPKRAMEDIQKARAIAPSEARYVYQLAVIEEIGHHRDQALKALGKALRAKYSVNEIARAPELADVRRDPRFQKLTQSQKSNKPN